MRKTKLVEAVLYQCLLTIGKDISVMDKVHILSWNQLIKIELQDLPRVFHPAYVEMQTLLDKLMQFSRSAGVNDMEEQNRTEIYQQFVVKLIDLYSRVICWNNLESYIESSHIRMKNVSAIQ